MAVYRELQGKEGLGLLRSGHAESRWKYDKLSKCKMKSHEGFLKVLKCYICTPVFASLLYNICVYVYNVCVLFVYIYLKRKNVVFGSKRLTFQVLVFIGKGSQQ